MGGFYEKYWQGRGDEHISDFYLKWPKLKNYIPRGKNVTVVDFGCGAGKVLEEIKKINPRAKLVGLDVSQRALRSAQKTLPNATFCEIADGERFPLDNNTADFVFSSEVIEHVYDTENAVSEISRILKPGGNLLLTTPHHGFLKNLLITLFAFDKHFNPTGPHVRFFSKKTLLNLLKKYGLEIERYGYYGRFYPISHSIFVLARKQA